MQIIQLYIEGQRVDLYEDESIDITQTIQNSKDIGKVFGDFSRSFTVPASRNNNKIFKHYYNSSIDDGFDARKKVDSLIRLNGVDFRKGRLKLEGVDLKDNKAQSYRITFYGNIVNLKDLVNEDKLDSLNWLRSFNVTYNLSTTLQYLQNGKDVTVDTVLYPEAVKIPLISAQQRLYFDSGESIAGKGNLSTHDSVAHGVEWYQMKPAIRLYVIIKAIEEKYNTTNGYPSDIKFSDDFFNVGNEKFHDLYMWLHREAGTVFQGIDGTLKDTIDTLPTVTWNGAQFNGSYFSIYDVYQFGAQYYNTEITLNTLAGSEFSFSVQKNGQIIFDSGVVTGQAQYVFDIGQLVNGSYTLHLESENVITVDGNVNTTRVHYYDPTISQSFAIGSFAMSSDFKFEIQSQVPDIKIIDFLSGLFKMFNLTAYEEEGIITVKPLDEYYLFGGEYDISEYVDINKSSVDSALLYKQIEFGYQGVKNLQANKHNELFNYNWGEEKYSGGDYYDGQIYKLTLPFEHMKMERLVNINTGTNSSVQWGWMVDKLNSSDEYANGSTYLGKPLLFYPVKVNGPDSIRVTSSGSYTDVTEYFVPSNSQLLTDSFNINFKAELNEYTNTVFENTIFYRYYRNYIAGIFDFRNRMTKVTAYLPLKVLLKYKLADRFIINNKKYLINSIQTNLLTGKSEIELLNDIAITYPLDPVELPRLGACTTQVETVIGENSFIANGTITDIGYPPYFERGFFYITGTGTPIETDPKITVSGTGTGTFLSTIAGLSPSTTYTYAAYVKNSVGTFIANPEQVTTATAIPLEPPTVSTTGETNVQATSVTLNGNVTNVGNPAITSRGFYWVVGTGTPSAANNVITVPGTSGGSYFSNLTGLTEGVTYSYRAWANNGVDPIALGAVDQFVPQTPVVQYPPTVSTTGESNVYETGVTLNGNVTYIGDPPITSKGFYWMLGTGTPTISNNVVTVSGNSAGPYSSNLTGLTQYAIYSYRAWADNSSDPIALGAVDEFVPQYVAPVEVPPAVVNLGANFTYNTATLYGEVTDIGNPSYYEKGFYWAEGSGLPTASDNVIYISGTSAGDFDSGEFGGLTENTLYTFRPFITSSLGTYYGDSSSFTTQQNQGQTPPAVVNLGSDFGYTNAILYGEVTNIGDPAYYEKGFYWMQGSGTPTSFNNVIYVLGTSAGAFQTPEFSGLIENTLYSFRPFIISALGTYYGATDTFTTQETPTVTCDGGTLFFTGASVTGVNATLQTGNLPYSTSQCGGTISTLSLLLTNNDTGEWVSAAQITSVQMFEGATNVTGDYSIGVVFNSGQIFITVDGNFPDAFNDGDHSYSFVIQATAVELLSTTITISDSVAHASKNVVANTSTSFPASRNGTTGNSVCIPQGEDGDAFEYTVTYTADPGYEFTGIGNITQPLVSPSGVGVGVTAGTYSSTTLTVIISGNIQAVDQAATVSWSGTAIADPATSINIEYRFQGQSTWNAIPGAGIDIGTGGIVVELKVTPDGSWYALPAVVNLIDAYSPTEDYSGDQVFMDVDIRVVGGAEPTQATLLRFYPRASATSIATVRFQYYEAI